MWSQGLALSYERGNPVPPQPVATEGSLFLQGGVEPFIFALYIRAPTCVEHHRLLENTLKKEGDGDLHTHIYIHIYVYMYTYIHIHVHIYTYIDAYELYHRLLEKTLKKEGDGGRARM